MKHILLIAGFIIELGVAGRFDCDVLNGVTSPSMVGWIVAGILLMIPELIWFMNAMKKAKELEEYER